MEPFQIRQPEARDGATLRILAQKSGLDENSTYCYLLMSHHFAQTAALAESGGQPAGFVAGFRPPTDPEAFFVWQVGVAPDFQGQGLGRDMILWLCGKQGAGLRFVEATITPDNKASQALFRSVARALSASWEFEHELFSKKHFGPFSHEAERLFRIGPIGPDK